MPLSQPTLRRLRAFEAGTTIDLLSFFHSAAEQLAFLADQLPTISNLGSSTGPLVLRQLSHWKTAGAELATLFALEAEHLSEVLELPALPVPPAAPLPALPSAALEDVRLRLEQALEVLRTHLASYLADPLDVRLRPLSQDAAVLTSLARDLAALFPLPGVSDRTAGASVPPGSTRTKGACP